MREREEGREGGRESESCTCTHACNTEKNNDNGNLKDISYTIGYFLFLSICSNNCY